MIRRLREGMQNILQTLQGEELRLFQSLLKSAEKDNKDYIDLIEYCYYLKSGYNYTEDKCSKTLIKIVMSANTTTSMFDDKCTFEYDFNPELNKRSVVKLILPTKKSNLERKIEYGVDSAEISQEKKRDIIASVDAINDFRNELRATGINKYVKMADASDRLLYSKLKNKDRILKDAQDAKEAKERKEAEQKAIDWDTPFDTIMNLNSKDLGKLIANVATISITTDSKDTNKLKVTADILNIDDDKVLDLLRSLDDDSDLNIKDDNTGHYWGVGANARLRSKNINDLPEDIKNVRDLNGDPIYSVTPSGYICLNRIGAVAALIRKGLKVSVVNSSDIKRVYDNATDKNAFVDGVKELADSFTQAGKKVPESIAAFLKLLDKIIEPETNESCKISKKDLKNLIKEALKEALQK